MHMLCISRRSGCGPFSTRGDSSEKDKGSCGCASGGGAIGTVPAGSCAGVRIRLALPGRNIQIWTGMPLNSIGWLASMNSGNIG